ncbi:Malate dehydrogenase [Mytilus coruscus]|uniref:Malate dehydrogenase n=1 Tax=Mytilus coruscus TaxID=42192 RepID=A0A6J8AMU3_MYTCO|nr:Malate dehydrogenase [Mytilus coruscus]
MVGTSTKRRIFSRIINSLTKYTCKRHSSTESTESWNLVPRKEVKRFIIECMSSVKTRQDHAEKLADNLSTADYRGHYSHGLNRLDMYVRDIDSGITERDGDPITIKESQATALVDGQNVLGPVVGDYSMQIAIQKAKQTGVGWVAAKGSNHYGIAGWYAMKAVDQGFLGLSFTNTSPLQVPTRARKPTLGTNPLSLAVPAKDKDSFVLDMATTTVALGKIELHDRKQISIPDGWGVDSEGKMCNVAKPVIETGGLMPLGGSEMTGGYKGYGLAMMVEIFCGILAGSDYGPNIRRWKSTERVANLGQCFIAVDPDCFAPGFVDRMSDLMNTCRNLTTAEGEDDTVLVAGDPERRHMNMCDQKGGIPYHPNQIKFGIELAKSLKVEPMKTLTG